MYKLTILAVVIVSVNLSHSTAISWGQIGNRHFLLFDQIFHERDNKYPVKPKEFYYSTRQMLITGIQVNDLTGTNGKTAVILQGGVHHTYVKMKLFPKNHLLLLNVEIFGTPLD